ncbi:MAG: NAD(P)/FAD-dependent oxidoreductase [Candidatus Dormibacteria bacterium]
MKGLTGTDAEYDVTVIGARLAGSMVAACLGQQGWRVLLLDQVHFPRPTVSTHFFRSPAFAAMRAIGAFEDVLALDAPKLTRMLVDFDGIQREVPVDGEDGFCLCVRRHLLDEVLQDRARREPTVQFEEGVRVGSISAAEHGPVVISDGSGRALARARLAVVAGGLHCGLIGDLDPVAEVEEPVRRAMYYAYYRGYSASARDTAEFHYRGDRLVYVFPCDGDLTLIAVSSPISQFANWRSDPATALTEVMGEHPTIRERLRHAEREGPVMGAGDIPSYARVPFGRGWVLVGDAGLVMDPFSGQGIDHALTHASMLGANLDTYLRGEMSWDSAMAEFHRSRNRFSMETLASTIAGSRDLRAVAQSALEEMGSEPSGQSPAR